MPQQSQPYSQYTKPFVSQSSSNDQTNETLMELVRELKEDKKNQQKIIDQQGSLLKEVMTKMEKLERGQTMQEPQHNQRNEKMKGKLDDNIPSEANSGTFPTQPLMNPRNVCLLDINPNASTEIDREKVTTAVPVISDLREEEDINAISTLRSGKILGDSIEPVKKNDFEKEVGEPKDSEECEASNGEQKTKDLDPKDYVPPIPFPAALKSAREKSDDSHLLQIFKETTITIPLIDAVQNIPSISKFLKELCTPTRKPKRIQLSERVSAMLLNEMPIKRRDPGAPLIFMLILCEYNACYHTF